MLGHLDVTNVGVGKETEVGGLPEKLEVSARMMRETDFEGIHLSENVVVQLEGNN